MQMQGLGKKAPVVPDEMRKQDFLCRQPAADQLTESIFFELRLKGSILAR